MSQHTLAVTSVCLAIALVAIVVLYVRQRQITARLRRQNNVLKGGDRLRDQELRHLVDERLPALAESAFGRPVEVPGPRHPRLSGTGFDEGVQAVMGTFAESLERARSRADHAAKATLKAMMRTVQSLANEQQLAISTMQERHDDPDVLEDLMRIDHMNAQLGRRTQATAVLCGSWPGQQRSASPLTDVVRGATSRIRDYLRVEVNAHLNVAIVSRVVEPVVLAVAELLDNAARHSQPNTSVEVNFQAAHNGVAIIIDDAGVAMDAEEMERATRLLSGRESVDINGLGDPPQVGFAVVGVLAARYGFTVSVDTRSPYGGVRAVVFLPSELLTRVETGPPTARTAADVPGTGAGTPAPPAVKAMSPATAAGMAPPTPAPAVGAATGAAAAPAHERQVTASGLPKRRRVTADAPTGERRLASGRGRAGSGNAPTGGQRLVSGRSVTPAGASVPGEPPADELFTEPPDLTGTDEFPAVDPAETGGSPARPASQIAAGMGAWQRGTRSGRATVSPDSEGNAQHE